jgi:hypothetical protein
MPETPGSILVNNILLFVGIPLVAIVLELLLAIVVGKALRYGIGAPGEPNS